MAKMGRNRGSDVGRRGGHYGAAGPKICYPTQQAAEIAVKDRQADGVRHDGRPWRRMNVYLCRVCGGWHFTTTAVLESPNYLNGGWARDWLVETIEIGWRASCLLKREQRGEVAGLAALARYTTRGGR